jgi:hypothetical protein
MVSCFHPNSERRTGGGVSLLLQAHRSIRKCSLALAFALPAAARETGPPFRADASLVLLRFDVMRDGALVRGLRAADIAILEDGVACAPVRFRSNSRCCSTPAAANRLPACSTRASSTPRSSANTRTSRCRCTASPMSGNVIRRHPDARGFAPHTARCRGPAHHRDPCGGGLLRGGGDAHQPARSHPPGARVRHRYRRIAAVTLTIS